MKEIHDGLSRGKKSCISSIRGTLADKIHQVTFAGIWRSLESEMENNTLLVIVGEKK